MPINLYSKDSVDDLLDAKLSDAPIDDSVYGRSNGAWVFVPGPGLSINTLSNWATSTLNAGVPTAGQALTYDGTDLKWATVTGDYLPLVGGTVTGPVIVDESATSGFTTTLSGAQLSFDGTGCYISGEETTTWGLSVSNCPAITFSDSTTQTTAAVAGANFGDAFTLGKVQDVSPLSGYWVITFAPVNAAVTNAGIFVSLSDGTSAEDVTGGGYSTSDTWSFTTTTLTSSDYIYITVNGQRSTIPISQP